MQEDLLRLLIIDDSEDDVFFLLHALTQAGLPFEHTHVETLDELREMLGETDWDVVITDHHLVGCSSRDVISLVKTTNSDLPVVIVSGEIDEREAIAAMHNGAQDFVMKDNLSRLVPVVMREKKQHDLKKSNRPLEEKYLFLCYHDSLTHLVNRQEFEVSIQQRVEDARQNGKTHLLMFLDLDHFKLFNDTCGHTAGDELLVKITAILKSCLRERDILARLSGDEFGILLEQCHQEYALTLARKISDAVKNSRFIWAGESHEITLSIGMVEINANAQDHQTLLSCADIACYAAKDQGPGSIVLFSPDDAEYTRRRGEMLWAPKIQQAAETNQFVLYHQPMANLQRSVGPHTEFLLRMNDNGKIIGPGEFIPAAERYNLMPLIDRWVIRHVFEYLNQSGLNQKGEGTYFINLSGSTLSDESFFEDIKRLQKQFQIPPHMICLEITETAAIANLVKAVEFISEIRQRGFKFALDDFGVGLSSFDYLKTIPVDYLKIDGSFVLNMLQNPIDRGIVEACNNIAHATGLLTVAEFVENDEIRQALVEIGVDFAQGFGIVKPGPLPTIHV
ncbi:MAG: EAL domain-containing protein [Hahellaceae bacterium]|nr:EAL domain-containing protein [Hahellaceae bacterium]MCP5169620.1 EAL domain-containing protein [Hahellaceae bacterium]